MLTSLVRRLLDRARNRNKVTSRTLCPHLRLEYNLHNALERDQFVIHYQPQMDMVTGQMMGVEALIRWRPNAHEVISPDVFIPIAEQTGLIVPLGEWVFRKACRQSRLWSDAGYDALKTSINLSSIQLEHPDTLSMINRVLKETDVDPQRISLELTETSLMTITNCRHVLNQLSAMGLSIAIDDFGTGYSSLSYLKYFPINTLKLDKSFMDDLFKDDECAIVKAVLSMAHDMHMTVVAEGVETVEQLDFLRKYNCDVVQGFYFSRPVTYDQIEVILAAQAATNALCNRE